MAAHAEDVDPLLDPQRSLRESAADRVKDIEMAQNEDIKPTTPPGETVQTTAAETEAASASRWPGMLVVIASIIAVMATVTIWVRVQALDTDAWVDAILRDDTIEGVSTADGVVALDLKPMVIEAAQAQGLSGSRVDELPEDAGRIVIFESGELDAAQTGVVVLEGLAWLLLVIVIGLYVAAVYLAEGRRIAVVRQLGWSLITVGLVVLVVRAVALRSLIDAFIEDPEGRSVADAVAAVATGLLQAAGWTLLIYGVLIVLFTTLLGDHSWAVATRRTLAPVLNSSTGAVVGGTVILLLLLTWWNPGQAFDRWLGTLLLLGLIGGAVATLRATTMEDFPDLVLADPQPSTEQEQSPDRQQSTAP